MKSLKSLTLDVIYRMFTYGLRYTDTQTDTNKQTDRQKDRQTQRTHRERDSQWHHRATDSLNKYSLCKSSQQWGFSIWLSVGFTVVVAVYIGYTQGKMASQNLFYGHKTIAILWVWHDIMCAVQGQEPSDQPTDWTIATCCWCYRLTAAAGDIACAPRGGERRIQSAAGREWA